MSKIPPISPGQLEAICRVLGGTEDGLTGSEIAHTLAQIGVKDTDPDMTKWKRLYNALAARQYADGCADKIFAFIARALEPARYLNARPLFELRRGGVNMTLAFIGYEFREDGIFHKTNRATTLTEAQQRANRLLGRLQDRNVHADVMKFCRAELLDDNCFHAVLEACKSVADKIRAKTGLLCDGAELVQQSLGGDNPLLRINPLTSDTEKGEQRGFVNLATGLFGTFRNPTAHDPRSKWPLSEEDALDIFCLVSYIHRRIDSAVIRKDAH